MMYGLDVSIADGYADLRALAELAAEAELAGWDGFFVQDYMAGDWPIVDPWIALAAVATRTQRLRIGAFMKALPRRRPWKVARETVALDRLSHGRLIFGAGLGWQASDFAAFGEAVDLKTRAEKLDEGLAILAGLWSGETFSFRGKHYQVNAARFLPRPVQSPRIPIWLGGGWPRRKPFQRAARWDGVHVMTKKADGERMAPDDIRDMAAYIQGQRERDEAFDIAFAGETPADPRQAAEIIRPYAEAGVTWWLEGVWEPLDEMRERIRRGPPP
jgi:alkanesulfonate monooxygenase SsuD/methylene tetrahydromethanopterin reductase-like flavin-dependent oxidoreductase (luciferase family)